MLDVIAFAAHPDDAEAACGGLLAQLARHGVQVAICDLTRGELGTNGTPEERAMEAAAAARTLGIAARLQLGLPDGGLDGRDTEQVDAVVRVLRTEAPRLVIAPHEGSRHPDHAATTAIVRRAHFFAAVPRYLSEVPPVVRPRLLRALDWQPMAPSYIVDITDTMDTKLAALRCYRTQFEAGPGRRPTVLNDPAWLHRIEANAHHYGARIGRRAGEPFAEDGDVAIADPLWLLPPPSEVRP